VELRKPSRRFLFGDLRTHKNADGVPMTLEEMVKDMRTRTFAAFHDVVLKCKTLVLEK
jgi:hypothetical protein